MYKSNGRSLESKDSKKLPKYLRAVDEYLRKHHDYERIKKLMKSKRRHHKLAEAIDEDITSATQYDE